MTINKFFEGIASATGVNPEDDSVFYVIYDDYENEDYADENYLEFAEDLSYCVIVKNNSIVDSFCIQDAENDIIKEIEISNKILEEITKYSQRRLNRIRDSRISF